VEVHHICAHLTALAVPATTPHTTGEGAGAHGTVPALSAPGARRVSRVPEPGKEGLDHPRSAEREDRQRAEGEPAALAAVRPALSAEQVNLVRRLLASGDLVRPVIGAAGTGKAEAIRALTDVVTATGRQVFATAHGGRQAEELAARIGIPARVVTSWLTLLDNVDDPAIVWPPGQVLIVDEATQGAEQGGHEGRSRPGHDHDGGPGTDVPGGQAGGHRAGQRSQLPVAPELPGAVVRAGRGPVGRPVLGEVDPAVSAPTSSSGTVQAAIAAPAVQPGRGRPPPAGWAASRPSGGEYRFAPAEVAVYQGRLVEVGW